MPERHPDGCDVLLVGFEGQENLGLRSVAAFLISSGIRAEIVPLQDASREWILEQVLRKQPRIVGFSLIFQRMLDDYADLIGYLRAHGVTGHFTVGGHFPTFEFEHMLESIPGLDSVVRHEGEETLLELFQNLDRFDAWPSIRGLAFRRDGRVCATLPRALIPDLDRLPFPVRDHPGATHRGIGIRSIAASRGCYYDCTFCSIHEFYRRSPGPLRRARSPEHVLREMEALYHDFGVRIFIFQDDDLFMRAPRHRRWVEGLLAGLGARGMNDQISWRVSCRVDDLDAGLLTAMKAAGLAAVYLGIESGSRQGLQTFNKHYGPDDVHRALALLRDIDLAFEFGFMLFEPYSTPASVRENIDFLKNVSAYGDCLVHFCKMSPYAGTAIARRLAADGRLEGTVACPDYRFFDPRLGLLQAFYAETFNFRNFDERGLVERLRFAKFDAGVVKRFFPDTHDADAYRRSVAELIRVSNESALEIMSLAAGLVESHTLDEIIDHWSILEDLRREEELVEQRVSVALDRLMTDYGFEASPGGRSGPTTCWPPVRAEAAPSVPSVA